MVYLIVDYGGARQHSGELTQEILENEYRSMGYNVYRFHQGQFQKLYAHKWRTAKEGGGWDEQSNWKARWENLGG